MIEIEDAKLTLIEEIGSKRSSEAKERVRQYEELHLKEKLVENGWYAITDNIKSMLKIRFNCSCFIVNFIYRCGILANEFITLSNLLPAKEESHDMVVASGKSLLTICELCKAKLKGNKLLYNSLYKLETHYKELAKQDNNLKPIYQLMNELTNTYDPVLE